MKKYDVIVAGGGIIGLSTAYKLLTKNPNLKVALLEKEAIVAKHQTGHNSGVIHSGIYYKPGSLKAKNCVKGVKELLRFCDQFQIPYDLCGKLVIATNTQEEKGLLELYRRGVSNGVEGLKILDQEGFKKIEPYAHGKLAMHCPNTGIVDYREVAKRLSLEIQKLGGSIFLNQKLQKIIKKDNEVILKTNNQEYQARYLICCCGLQADEVAKKNNEIFKEKIIPFRGEYYFLSEEKQAQLNGLIYPVPNPEFPFLGVHLTKRMNGQVELGPNAVLAYGKEGYEKRYIRPLDMGKYLSYRGFWSMVRRNFKVGAYEFIRSYSKSLFLKDIQKLMPSIKMEDLKKGGSGVRAQLVNPDGSMHDDFLIRSDGQVLHVLNAPSPGATSSLSIGESVANQALEYVGFQYVK